MKIYVNGKEESLDLQENSSDVETVVKLMGHDPRVIVVELNGLILPRSKWNNQIVKDEDSFEIVTIVGGGA